mmetsp:Transcript_12789/g.32618  ORF Transcript_12789/g.32618 Transcript_12789/m.32618 type:complete len:117 (-) Transcript_12789:199-549(-)
MSACESLPSKWCKRTRPQVLHNARFCFKLADTCGLDTAVLCSLAGVHAIDLTNCLWVRDEGLQALAGVHTIELRDCENIGDEGVKALAGVHTIGLRGCGKITDEGVKACRACIPST